MKLFLIFQTENKDYDTYDQAVVCAADAEAARMIHPGREDWLKPLPRAFTSWAYSPQGVHVALIGDAAPHMKPGIVCASFNAG